MIDDFDLVNWKSLTDKNLQLLIEKLIKKFQNSDLIHCKESIDFVWQIIRSHECSLNVKLRFGYLILFGIIKLNYPYTIHELILEDNSDSDTVLSILNGIVDCKSQTNIFPLSIQSESKTIIFTKLDLSFLLLNQLYKNNYKEYYHLAVLNKRIWDIVEREYKEHGTCPPFLYISNFVRFFLPLLDSSIPGLPGLLCDSFSAIIKWSHISNSQNVEIFFIDDILHEFFNGNTNDSLSYPLCKINLRYLKIIVRGFGAKKIFQKLPLIFEYILNVCSVNYTASIAGDVFMAVVKSLESHDCQVKEVLINTIKNYMINGCDNIWFSEGSNELLSLNFAQFSLPSLVERFPDDLRTINNIILLKLSDHKSFEMRDHCQFSWVTSFTLSNIKINNVTETERKCFLSCLYHSNDQIRITAYKFVCENYIEGFFRDQCINLPMILDVCANNLTSDNPSFRNHFISATKRLLILIRDSVLPHLSDQEILMKDIEVIMKNDVFKKTNTTYLESISWVEIVKSMESVVHKDISVFLMFCRYVYCNQWFHLSMNYQRQRSMADLILCIREVIIDPLFVIDKKSGFKKETVMSIRNFYQGICAEHIIDLKEISYIFIESLQKSKSDVQNTFYDLLIHTQKDFLNTNKSNIDFDKQWSLSEKLCHSNQPTQLSSGSFIVSFLCQCSYIPPHFLSVSHYLVNFLEEISRVDISSVLDVALRRPGHGYFLALDVLMKESVVDCLLKSDRVAIAAIEVTNVMLRIMGCDQHEMASFHKIGITINTLASFRNTKISNESIIMLAEYQHILSWSWQVLRMATTTLVNWCRIVDKERNSTLFYDIGLLLLRVMFQSRHRGTIESISGCLQSYIQLAERSLNSGHWISAKEVALDECIGGAVRGNHSITRRSAGLPLVLMAALSGSADGRNLSRECISQLITLARKEENNVDPQLLCDPPIVHYLNLIRHMCQHPSLVLHIQLHYGEVVLIALDNFSSSHWGVRNAALQLFTSMISRLAALTRVNPTFGELFSMYPELWNPLLFIVENGSKSSRSFHKHKTLVPALTLLSNVQFCHDNLIPESLKILDLRQLLWPLLSNEVMTVRRLAAKCIVKSLPNSLFCLDIVKRNTQTITLLLEPQHNFVDITSSQQHGELFLLNIMMKNLKLNNVNVNLHIILQYCHSAIVRKCWLLLDSYVHVLFFTELNDENQMILFNFLNSTIIEMLGSDSFEGEIGRQVVMVSIIKLIVQLNPAAASDISKCLLSISNVYILQELTSETFIPDLFTDTFDLLFQQLCHSLENYQAHYSPYLCQIFLKVIVKRGSFTVLCLQKLSNLLMKTISSRVAESVTVTCMDILTMLIVKSEIMSENEIMFFINQLEYGLKASSPEDKRLTNVNNLVTVMSSDRSDYVKNLYPARIACIYTMGCFDECRQVRLMFRSSLFNIINLKSNNNNITLSQNDLVLFYRHISHKSSSSLNYVLLFIWEHIISYNITFYREVKECRDKDALYEPVQANIYVEDVLLLEVLYGELRRESILDRSEIVRLISLHLEFVDENNYSDFSTFILKSSLRLLNCLMNI